VNKTVKTILIIIVMLVLVSGSFAGGFLTGHLLPVGRQLPILKDVVPAPPTISSEQQDTTPQDLQALFKPFWEAWNIVHDEYVDQPVDDLKLMQGAIKGMIEALGDKHSSYMDPQTFKTANEELSGEYDGIGAFVDTTTDYLTIISPMPNSPAEKVGLLTGDKIIKIDGEDMTGLDAELARRKVLGPAGTTVTLTVVREGESEPLEFVIIREHIVVKSATGKMLDNGIAYVQITTFGDKTTNELKNALEELMAQNPKGLILDLRNNGGGYLQTSVEVTSQFVDEGVVLYEQFGNGKRNTYEVIPGGKATKIPMVVLINEGTASASEIVSGALQDYGRAKLVGIKSYGKGTVQDWAPLSDNQGAVRVTIAKWLTPKERTIHEKGLTPDIIIETTQEDIKAKKDPQLDKAVEVLLQMLAVSASN